MLNVEVIIAIIVGIITIMMTFFKLVYDYATLKATTSQILKEVLELKKYFLKHDCILDNHENRITIIEVNCKNRNKEV